MDGTWLFTQLVVGAFGLAYFMYGKKQHMAVPMISGILMMALPYAAPSLGGVLLITAACMAAPFLLRY